MMSRFSMNIARIVWIGLGILAIFQSGRVWGADLTVDEQAAERVGKALHAEMEGDFLVRAQLLKEAAKLQSEFAPAQWLIGRVADGNGEWLSIEEAILQGKENQLLNEYTAMREQLPDTVEGNWQAALWCAKRQMAFQARAHVENMLTLDPENAIARRLLGHQLVGNNWLTPADLKKWAQRAEFAAIGNAKYRKRITQLLKKREHESLKVREAAIQELKEINDPYAIPVMVTAAQKTNEHASLVVDWLADVDHQEASLALAGIAVFSDDRYIAEQAAEHLKTKPLYDFMPELLTAMTAPVTLQTLPILDRSGNVVGLRQTLSTEGMNDYRNLHIERRFFSLALAPMLVRDPSISGASGVQLAASPALRLMNELNRLAGTVIAESQAFQQRALSEHRITERLNNRIGAVIAAVSGFTFEQLPNDAWEWWDEQNGSEYQRNKFARHQYLDESSNLVVADSHTYFVGNSRVLSHDVLPRGSVYERVPGEFSIAEKP